jgi:hypothetical protein
MEVFIAVTWGGIEATQPLHFLGEKTRLLTQLAANTIHRVLPRFNAPRRYLK